MSNDPRRHGTEWAKGFCGILFGMYFAYSKSVISKAYPNVMSLEVDYVHVVVE